MFAPSESRRPQALNTHPSSSSGSNPPGPTTPFPNTSINRTRTSHACDRCRTMRTKCSGGQRCTKCVKDDAVCQYGDRKRERNRKDLAESVDRIHELEDENRILLAALQVLVEDRDFDSTKYEAVVNLVNSVRNSEPWCSGSLTTPPQYSNKDWVEGSQSNASSLRSPAVASEGTGAVESRDDESGRRAEDCTDSSVGSPGRQGELRMAVDLDHGMGASGFVGKLSEMSWMQRAKEYLSKPSQSPNDNFIATFDDHTQAAQHLTYFMDDTNLLSVDEDTVDPLQWPPYNSALILSEACFFAVQGPFSFVVREQFFEMMAAMASKRSIPTWRERRWLAVANLVWAIGLKWLRSMRLDEGFQESHLLFYARARALGLDHRILYDHPDLEMVQGIGLLAFYLMANGSISRAWNILGNAIRHATALGLYLRVTDETIDELDRESRAHTWFSLYNLEILVAELTGRPHSIQTAQATVSLDTITEHSTARYQHGFDSDHPEQKSRVLWLKFLATVGDRGNSARGDGLTWHHLASFRVPTTYFHQHVQLCSISAAIASQLYLGTSENAWSKTQECIRSLQRHLDTWVENLSDDLRPHQGDGNDLHPRARTHLAMYYHSVTMLLHRPCLCDIKIEGESTNSKDFNQRSARTCVHAASALLDLAPDDPATQEARQILPWWTLLHFVCQSAAVLLLELCLDCQHFQSETRNVILAMMKAMRYLWYMSSQSMSTHRAWRIFRALLEEVASRSDAYYQLRIEDDALRPDGWSTEAEKSVLAAIEDIGGRR